MRKARECWPVLARKAEDSVRQWQNEIARSQSRLEQLQASLDRLDHMYAEYRNRQLQPQQQALGMNGHMHQRQFMGQLLQLQQRVQQDLDQAQTTLAQQRKQLILAEIEHQKMLALAEQDQRNVERHTQLMEQRRLDELAISRFNLRPGL